jgi:hypothetical protein
MLHSCIHLIKREAAPRESIMNQLHSSPSVRGKENNCMPHDQPPPFQLVPCMFLSLSFFTPVSFMVRSPDESLGRAKNFVDTYLLFVQTAMMIVSSHAFSLPKSATDQTEHLLCCTIGSNARSRQLRCKNTRQRSVHSATLYLLCRHAFQRHRHYHLSVPDRSTWKPKGRRAEYERFNPLTVRNAPSHWGPIFDNHLISMCVTTSWTLCYPLTNPKGCCTLWSESSPSCSRHSRTSGYGKDW